MQPRRRCTALATPPPRKQHNFPSHCALRANMCLLALNHLVCSTTHRHLEVLLTIQRHKLRSVVLNVASSSQSPAGAIEAVGTAACPRKSPCNRTSRAAHVWDSSLPKWMPRGRVAAAPGVQKPRHRRQLCNVCGAPVWSPCPRGVWCTGASSSHIHYCCPHFPQKAQYTTPLLLLPYFCVVVFCFCHKAKARLQSLIKLYVLCESSRRAPRQPPPPDPAAAAAVQRLSRATPSYSSPATPVPIRRCPDPL